MEHNNSRTYITRVIEYKKLQNNEKNNPKTKIMVRKHRLGLNLVSNKAGK